MNANQKAPPAKFLPRDHKPIATSRQLCIIRYSPDGKLLAGGDFTGGIARWDASGDGLVSLPTLTGHSGWVQALAFHGKTLFSGDSWGRLCAWPFADKEPKPTWNNATAHPGWVRKLAVAPGGKTLASCDSKGWLRLWSSETGKQLGEWQHHLDLLALDYAPDGKTLVTGDLEGGIQRRDVSTGKVVVEYQAKEMYRLDRIQDVGGVRSLAFSPDGKTLVAGGCVPTTGGFVQGAGLLVYFDAATGKRTGTLEIGKTNDGYVHDLTWHPDGFVMAVTSGQPGVGKLTFHRPGEGTAFFTATKMANCLSLAANPDGRRVVVAATNANSSGNGRPLDSKKQYPGNSSPLYIWDIPKS